MYICLKFTQFLKINAGNSLSVHINYEELRLRQENDPEPEQILNNQESSGMNLKPANRLYCHIENTDRGEKIRAYIPASYQQTVFDFVHNTAHPGVRGTVWQICK